MSPTISKTVDAAESDNTSTISLSPPAKPATRPLHDERVIIQPTRGWMSVNLREIWRYRELLYFLALRDVKVRYKQTILGVLWVVMQPLLSTLIFTFVLGMLARVPSEGLPYPLFVYAGLLPWIFFSAAVNSAGNSLVGSAHLITKVYFPRMIVPAAAIAARLPDLAIGLVFLAGIMLYYGVPLQRNLLMLPVIVAVVTLLSLAIGMWLSAINVRYRDAGVLLPVIIQAWMFASPIVYPSSLAYSMMGSNVLRRLYALNPLVGIVENFRAAIFGQPFNWPALVIAAAIAVVLLAFAVYDFRRMERNFADII